MPAGAESGLSAPRAAGWTVTALAGEKRTSPGLPPGWVAEPVLLLAKLPHLSARHASRSRSAHRGRHLSSFPLSPTPANGQASRPHKRCLPRVRFRPVPSTHGWAEQGHSRVRCQ